MALAEHQNGQVAEHQKMNDQSRCAGAVRNVDGPRQISIPAIRQTGLMK
jgi:hypothetical protein